MDRRHSELRELADRFEYPEIWHQFGLLDLGQLYSDVASLEDDPRIELYRFRAMVRLVDARTTWSESALATFLTLVELEPSTSVAGSALDYLVESETLSVFQLEELQSDERWASISGMLYEEMLMRKVRDDIHDRDAQMDAATHGGRKVHLFLMALPTVETSVLEVLIERGADRSIRNQARSLIRRRAD